MNYWLFKSEPDAWSWDQQKKEGAKGAEWDGVRNYQARNTLRDDVKRGDGILFYHSQSDKAVMGTCKVTKRGFPDPANDTWTVIEIELTAPLTTPVTLEAMREVPGLAKMVLLQPGSRLSVQPVSEAEWEIVLKLGRG